MSEWFTILLVGWTLFGGVTGWGVLEHFPEVFKRPLSGFFIVLPCGPLAVFCWLVFVLGCLGVVIYAGLRVLEDSIGDWWKR